MKKKITFLTLGAALIAVPVLAAPAAADRNVTMTRAEAQAHATEKFAKLDVNKDGKLDASDRAAKRAEMQTQMFERLDANKDGSLTREELKSGLDAWYTKWDSAGTNGVTMDQVFRGLAEVVPLPSP